MSFAILVRKHLQDDIKAADALDWAFVQVQVLLAYCDGHLSTGEKMTISLLTLARPDEKESRKAIESLISNIEKCGFAESSETALRDLDRAMGRVKEGKRSEVGFDLLRESVNLVIADEVISSSERDFLVKRLAPRVFVSEARASALLDDASVQLQRSRMSVETALELYLMISDLSPLNLSLTGAGSLGEQSFLGRVDQLVQAQKLGSSRVTSYFLGANFGVFWSEQAEAICKEFGTSVERLRKRRGVSSEKRLGEIHNQLEKLVEEKKDENAFGAVARHLTNSLGRLEQLDETQRAFFRDKICPALKIEHGKLMDTASNRASLFDLHRNLTGLSTVPGDSRKWWEFWR